jgi:hypothetical protein
MLNFKKVAVAAVVAMSAVSAMASNFRAGDQVYVPAAGYLSGNSGTFISDVFISNLSADSVDVSVIFSQGPAGAQQEFRNLLTLAPNERREIVNFVGTPVAQGGLGLAASANPFGQLIFNACKQGADCINTQDEFGYSINFRDISVESRIYSIPAGTTPAQNPPTTGQLFSGIPWYNFVSSNAANVGLHQVMITGIRNNGTNGQAGTYRANIGMTNASQFSATDIVVSLFDGKTGNKLGEYTERLQPLGHVQRNIAAMFGSFTGAAATNAYAIVEQRNSTATSNAPANCLPEGCPAFFAYGSILDNVSGDATTLEPQYMKPLSKEALAQIYPQTAGKSPLRRSVRRF